MNEDTDAQDYFDVRSFDLPNYITAYQQDEEYQEDEDLPNAEEEDARQNIDKTNLSNDLPLYWGAPLTVMQSMLMLLALQVKHNINMSCLDDIIKVVNLHCAPEGLIRNSLSKFKKTFALNEKLNQHFYCTTCQRELPSKMSVCPLCPREENCYFVEMSLKDQLFQMYQREKFYEKLQNRIHRSTNNGNICDIYDGEIYKKWLNHGFLKNPHNISFSWYTDGVPVFKSSQTSMWPIYLSINELPFLERKKRENTLLLGLWCGKKPFANLFLYKIKPQLDELITGITVFLKPDVEPIIVRGILLMGTADLLAKNDFMNFKQFNGYYGCTICDIKGENLKLVPRGRLHIYPFQQNTNLRTLQNCLTWANEATQDNPVMGIKGPSALSLIMPDYIQGMAIDRMHAVEGGVIKKILYLLFDSSCRNFCFSLFTEKHIVSTRLTDLKPPKFVHRMPRSVTDLVHWKASELRMWCFYYSIPILYGIMRQDYFDNYLLLVTAVSLLSSDNISNSKLNAAEDLIKSLKFCMDRDTVQLLFIYYCT
ncbi:uncharacterized protein LOC129915418 isoform X2 [Episyrphus balteatus]|nr:uncharacterized protein LOC129915417 isoform X2 [Episyrphus balteatus]XP_055850912.1 uncharacterized protein LOC129915418 isoform X2 [Episyrphus balteatus]